MGLSRRAYAKHRKALGLSGGSEAAVRKALEAGRISLLADGTIDPVQADREWGGSTDANKLRGSNPALKPKKPKDEYRLDEDDDERPVIIANPTAGMDEKQAATLNQIRVAREKVKLAEEVDLRKLRKGELMERAPARKLYFELGLFVQSKWQTFADVEGPSIAAKFDAEEHEVVQDLKVRVERFLNEMIDELEDPLAPPPEKSRAK